MAPLGLHIGLSLNEKSNPAKMPEFDNFPPVIFSVWSTKREFSHSDLIQMWNNFL